MNKYGKKSATNLKECHRDLQIIFAVVLIGWDNSVLTGAREEEEQTEAFLSGNSKLRWPLSRHNKKPSMAADVTPYPIPKDWGENDPDEYAKFRFFAFYVVGIADCLLACNVITHQIRWGGDWDMDKDVTDQTFNDLIHFELVGD